MSTQTWVIQQFDPKTASQQEWERYHGYRKTRHVERERDEPLFPDDQVETMMKMDDPYSKPFHFGISDGDLLVSSFGGGIATPEAPGYDSNKQYFWFGGSVLKGYRRRGVGRLWLPKLLELMQETETTVATTGTDEPDGHEFLKWSGFEGKQEGAENRLRWDEIDWDLVDSWIAEGQKRSPESKLEFYENRLPDAFLEEYATAMTPLLNTMPFDDLDHGEIVFTADVLREYYKRGDQIGAEHNVALIREPDGSISGMTDVFWIPAQATFVQQQFTGVHPDARGRGLGKWLKAYMLRFLKGRYDGLEWVTTGNANSNDPMLGINKRLGFKEHRPNVAYQISRDTLADFVNKL